VVDDRQTRRGRARAGPTAIAAGLAKLAGVPRMSLVEDPSERSGADTMFPGTVSDQRLGELGYDLVGEHRQAVGFAGFGAGDRVLDVASGSGRLAFALAAAGCRVVSGDIDGEVVRETRERVGAFTRDAVLFRVMDATHLNQSDADLACVATADSLHHMEEPERALEEMTRVLRDDGRLLIIEFNPHGFRVMDQVCRAVHQLPHEQGRLTSQAICEFLRARFESVEHHVLPLNDVWIARGKRRGPVEAGRVHHRQCFACGPANPDGLKLHFEAAGVHAVVAHCTIDEKFQGYDGVVQGGIVSLLLDSAMTNCLFRLGVKAMTARLNVRFRSPVQTRVPLVVTACLLQQEHPRRLQKSIYTLSTTIEQDGRERATATGTFVGIG
jgi:ubiquinone/menaquinone biosynthesis C-methylase UbiE/acyl-coenzyme A thioesterase PaaI-like protein